MPATKKVAGAPATPKWTPEQLLRVKHMGPALIGQEMYDAAQAYVASTGSGKFGPALLGIGSYGGPTAEQFAAMQAEKTRADATTTTA